VTAPAGEDTELDGLVDRMLAGERRALARLITRVENREAGVAEIMRRIHPRSGGTIARPGSGPGRRRGSCSCSSGPPR
jgi:LAO/AO transport system kinase